MVDSLLPGKEGSQFPGVILKYYFGSSLHTQEFSASFMSLQLNLVNNKFASTVFILTKFHSLAAGHLLPGH